MRKATEPEGVKAFSSLYRCAVPMHCLSVAGSINSPLCAVIQERQAFMGKASLSRGNYENYCKDKSIKEIFEDELDAVIERLMNAGGAADGRDPGRGESLAWCIAVIENPYAPNMDDVKGRAMLRYEASLLESIPEEPSSGFEEEANFTTTDYSAEHVE